MSRGFIAPLTGLLLALPLLVTAQTPQNAEYWLQEGHKHMMKKEWAQAQKSYKKSLELMPNNAIAHWNLSVALGQTNDNDAAVKSADEAIRLGLNVSGVYLSRAKAYVKLAGADKDKDKQKELYERAIADAQKVIDHKKHKLIMIEPFELSFAHAALSISYKALGQAEKAKEHQKKAVELMPKKK
jgi:tetratricopeptide (TPR) repeat protein